MVWTGVEPRFHHPLAGWWHETVLSSLFLIWKWVDELPGLVVQDPQQENSGLGLSWKPPPGEAVGGGYWPPLGLE